MPWSLPRTYTPGFADFVKKLYPGLVTGAEGMPKVDESKSPEAVFDSLPFSTWKEAKLMPCVRYLRGNKHLKIPDSWLEVFPRPFEILLQMEQRLQA